MITLRPYQQIALDGIRQSYRDKCRAPLLVSPTGSGKTTMFAEVTRGAMRRGNTVAILAHRTELIDQISQALSEIDVEHDIIAADYSRLNATVTVASVQTLIRRIDKIPAPDLVVLDEAHHCANGNTWSKILSAWKSSLRLGVTATPIRQDGRGLGEHFDRLVLAPSAAELTAQGFLAPARVFAPPTIDTSGLHVRAGDYVTAETEAIADTPSVTGDALKHYRKYADGKPAIVFCTSIAHADHVAKQFRDAGYQAASLNGGSGRDIRRMAVTDFRSGSLQVLASCDLFSEGFDVPGVHVGILLRPTASMGLFLQQVGRCLRLSPGKKEAIILDHASNCVRFGLPTDDREWTLTYDERKKTSKSAPEVRVCPVCFAASSARARACSNCKEPFQIQHREVEEREGELVELTPEQIQARRERIQQGRSNSLASLLAFARKKGYSEGWALHVMAAREKKAAEKLAKKRQDGATPLRALR